MSNTSFERNAEDISERLALCAERIKTIPSENRIPKPFLEFFAREAEFLSYIFELYEKLKNEDAKSVSVDELKERNRKLYGELLPDNYDTCFGNPDYACKKLGKDYGAIFSAIYAELRGTIVYIYEDRAWDLVVCAELFLECASEFCDEEIPTAETLRRIFASYNYDYCADFVRERIERQVNPDFDFALKIVMDADLNDTRYLYHYGEYISDNEIKTAEFLNSLDEAEIDAMARTLTEGYRIGFIATGKDITKKKTVNIRYSIGFERMVRSAIRMFDKMGLKTILYRTAAHCVSKNRIRIGYFGGDPNPQFGFDHIGDEALYLSEKFVTRKLSAMRSAFEENKALSNTHGGPAWIDVFGEEPFAPKVKENALSLSDEQRALKLKYESEAGQITNRYIIGEERSYTIIAYPVPEIGSDYEAIFKETVRINTLDYKTYRDIQQKIIDILDMGERVVVKGRAGNKTNMTVSLHKLTDPAAQTNFENCVADVNIPVGEVFTSPVLKGTEGILHVSQVYLEGLCFKDLEIHVKDGMAVAYTCSNFDDADDGRKYILENIMFNHEKLPIGEFAIGTNTTAYAMAKRFDIFEKLPILIAEKTGPHFAFGDTCYSHEEDLKTYNPDGKEITARENEISAQRKADMSKAYFNCHTDITIPYNELDCIYAVTKDDEKLYIIKDGRFVVKGTEMLNEPLDNSL